MAPAGFTRQAKEEHPIADDKPDEIEVHFVRGDQQWKSEAERDAGVVTLKITQKLRRPID
ncbi:hypothetical protein FM104_02960 [Microbacterium esteraromaticum]|uniref:Uncharacterized protein n=1 Tax=Microbacterium esteraromaticum TaxID=57043 RepID=A0A1R4IMY4_9MICO|nr:hypothetical protein FM104_02960 [Microbacterium esteraromaticum]